MGQPEGVGMRKGTARRRRNEKGDSPKASVNVGLSERQPEGVSGEDVGGRRGETETA